MNLILTLKQKNQKKIVKKKNTLKTVEEMNLTAQTFSTEINAPEKEKEKDCRCCTQ